MKRIILLSALVLCSLVLSAQDYFTLTLELVKPTGKIDRKSYFQASLRNNLDSVSFFVPKKAANVFSPRKYSLMRVCRDWSDGSQSESNLQNFFYFEEEEVLVISPRSAYVTTMPIFMMGMEEAGLLPFTKENLLKVRRVRIKLENFRMVGNKSFPIQSIDLYSNWININPADFVEFLEGRARPAGK